MSTSRISLEPRKSEQYMDLSSPNSLTASFSKDKSHKQPDLGHVSFRNVCWVVYCHDAILGESSVG